MTELIKRSDCTCFNVEKVTRLRGLAETADVSGRAKAFKAVGHPRRLLTLYLIGEGQLCVCDLAHTLDAPVSTVSQYLRILKDAGLIYDVQDHKFMIYHLTNLGREILGGLTHE